MKPFGIEARDFILSLVGWVLSVLGLMLIVKRSMEPAEILLEALVWILTGSGYLYLLLHPKVPHRRQAILLSAIGVVLWVAGLRFTAALEGLVGGSPNLAEAIAWALGWATLWPFLNGLRVAWLLRGYGFLLWAAPVAAAFPSAQKDKFWAAMAAKYPPRWWWIAAVVVFALSCIPMLRFAAKILHDYGPYGIENWRNIRPP